MTAQRLPLRPQVDVRGQGLTSQRVRDRMVQRLREQGIANPAVLQVMGSVPRHLFVDEVLASRAYEDTALPIGAGQTISQPWVVARMTEAALEVNPSKVLEIGAGSGYQAAVLSALGLEVHTVERIAELLRGARKRWRSLGMEIRSKHDDGHVGWADNGPFDAILVTAGGQAVVPQLLEQLKPGGVMIAPVGPAASQKLLRIRKDEQGKLTEDSLGAVVFVPLLAGLVD
ncbi:protein-L-isoaspartate(D-aspartate) O-methyltransferase [Luteimonas sp. FXH3W]|uniref:Protein-L-isoaspartate O-methyltransferase n=1 Tax=Aquilutibacter rugosus TaxID=3115820 RepID=A0ABU7V0G4_9GAMM